MSLQYPDAPMSLFSYWWGLGRSEQVDGYVRMVETRPFPDWIEPHVNELDSQRIFHALPRFMSHKVDNKFSLFQLYQGTDAEAVFPPTYASIQDALEATRDNADSNMLFFLKDSIGTQGLNIRVLRRSEVKAEPELDYPGQYIVQRGISNLLTVDDGKGTGALHGRRFDVRFFALVHNGTLYLHSNMYAMWRGSVRYDPNDANIENNVPKLVGYHQDGEKKVDVIADFLFFPDAGDTWNRHGRKPFSNDSSPFLLNPIAWRNAIADAMDVAKPVFGALLDATLADPTSYHLFGSDALVRKSGEAVLIEFNDWSDYSFHIKSLREACQDGGPCGRRVVVPSSDPSGIGYDIAPPSVAFYDVGSAYTAQILRDVASLVMGLEAPADMKRFREIGLD